ncbi:MAG: cupin domain-containing protein, partial [Oscillatoria sp. PMC 1076.18]|nr:cupin domain-containing protein [Oscillatoria sp. PMC 1076.18]
ANIFFLPSKLGESEIFESLLTGRNILIERIISTGQITPEGEWYNQEKDEWVVLLQGEAKLAYADASSRDLKAGDYVFLPAHKKHRVEYTSSEPPCIWLAIHGNF